MPNDTVTEVPAPDQSVASIGRLLTFWQDSDSAEMPMLADGFMRSVNVHVMVAHTVATARAAVALVQGGMGLQSIPLVRLSMECAVTAAWIATTPGADLAAAHEGAKSYRTLLRTLARLAGEDPGRATDVAEADNEVAELATFADGEAKSFEQRCGAIAGGEWLYPYYRMLSASSHAGTPLLDRYLTLGEPAAETVTGLRFLDPQESPHIAVALGVQTVILHMGLTAWDSLVPNHPNRAALTSIGDELGMVSFLTRSSRAFRQPAT